MHSFPKRIHARFRWMLTFVCFVAFLACQSDEEQIASHVARAEELQKEGQIEAAILEYRSALNVDVNDADVNQRIAELMRSQGAVVDAAHFFFLESDYVLRIHGFEEAASLASVPSVR